MPTINIAIYEDHRRISTFYKVVGYGVGFRRDDFIFMALEHNGLAGVVRLCTE